MVESFCRIILLIGDLQDLACKVIAVVQAYVFAGCLQALAHPAHPSFGIIAVPAFAVFILRIGYRPGEPLLVEAWFSCIGQVIKTGQPLASGRCRCRMQVGQTPVRGCALKNSLQGSIASAKLECCAAGVIDPAFYWSAQSIVVGIAVGAPKALLGILREADLAIPSVDVFGLARIRL
ncbi:hypothetical protein ADICEAN_04259 [Cesiribacter andamanensis AMV16]|uniref:Uncharacterized protein n=1 Tax=Cesiribacter andamanensis AMV16 TaxID=1279009 RepID=M7MW01_9BACT|nr:hypothetical protein ADICEAN_04259 [Cesiribacter andamanensis AMV16]